MLTVHNISKSFGVDTILDAVTFHINSGQRTGLVGPNGCGKTTLLRILTGLDKPDSGFVRFDPPDLRVGYLAQGLVPSPAETIASFLARAIGDTNALTSEVERWATSLTQLPTHPITQHQYDVALARLAAAHEHESRAPAVLAALGLDGLPSHTPASVLSGGQKTRLGLASVLLSDPQLLLLDEPSNHLDIDMLEWLEDWLIQFSGGVLLVSHDRAFLDAICDRILELDPATHTIREYAGNYTDYLERKLAEREKKQQAYSDWQEEIAQLQNAARHLRGVARFRRGGKGDSGDKFAKGFFANRAQGTIGRAKHIEARVEKLLSEDRVEKPRNSWQMKLEFGETPASSRDVLTLENLSVGYGDKAVLNDLNARLRFGARAVLTGPNGCGKTTLLRTVSGIQPPLAGRSRLGSSVRVGYMAQEQEGLDPNMNAFETIRALAIAPMSETDARTFLHLFLFSGDNVFTPTRSLSYGERARLLLACLAARGCNFLLLDEPINHLDIPSRARFEQALSAFEGAILTVVHDRYFIASFAAEIWQIAHGQLKIAPVGA